MRSLAEKQDVAGLHKMPTGVEGFDAGSGANFKKARRADPGALGGATQSTDEIHDPDSARARRTATRPYRIAK